MKNKRNYVLVIVMVVLVSIGFASTSAEFAKSCEIFSSHVSKDSFIIGTAIGKISYVVDKETKADCVYVNFSNDWNVDDTYTLLKNIYSQKYNLRFSGENVNSYLDDDKNFEIKVVKSGIVGGYVSYTKYDKDQQVWKLQSRYISNGMTIETYELNGVTKTYINGKLDSTFYYYSE